MYDSKTPILKLLPKSPLKELYHCDEKLVISHILVSRKSQREKRVGLQVTF